MSDGPENSWLSQAKRLQAIAATGLHFTEHHYDRERYEEVAAIAERMLADLAQVPIERISELVPHPSQGYATPMIDVRGAVLREESILLVREVVDGLWTLPGGFADLGLSAAENVEKEIREEAGLNTRATALYAVRHKAKHAYAQDVRDFYKFFFLCEEVGERIAPKVGPETSGAQFVRRGSWPPMSSGRTIEADLEDAFRFRDGGSVVFD